MAVISWARCTQATTAVMMAATLAAAADQRPLQINVLEGEGAFNDIKRGLARSPVVEVKDEAGKVVENAKVVFQLPDMGASGTFLDGSRTFVGNSDKQGRAAAPALKPNRIEGPFAIVVIASKDGSTGRAEIRESNTLAGGTMTAGGGGGGGKLKVIIAVLGVVGGGAALASHFVGGSKDGGATGSVTAAAPTNLSVGTVTIGGPR
jgi:hypothetical protein